MKKKKNAKSGSMKSSTSGCDMTASIDSLVEVTASFFKKGMRTSMSHLEDDIACFSVPDIYNATAMVEHPSVGLTTTSDGVDDCEFLEDVVAFSFQVVSEGRVGYPHGCGLDYEIQNCTQQEVFDKWRDDLIKDAIAMQDEIKGEYEQFKNGQWVKDEGEPDSVRWLAAVGFWATGGGWYEDYDCGTVYLGRVKLSNALLAK